MKDNQLDFSRIIAEIWNYKLLYVVVIFFALSIWFLYVKFASETYSVRSTILIRTKNETTHTASTELMNVYDILGQDIIMQNELNILNSTPLINEVLNDLGQIVSYYKQQDNIPKQLSFGLKNIYDQAPFMVIYNMDHIQPINTLFNINILNNEEFAIECSGEKVWLYNYRTENYASQIDGINFSGKFKFGENIETDHFSFKLLRNSNHDLSEFLYKDMFFELNDLNSLAKQFQSSLKIEVTTLEGTIATIDFVGSNIQLSLDFVAGLITKYIDKNLEEKTFLASNTIQYIDRQLAMISDTLTQTEQELSNFRRIHNIMDVDEKSLRILTQRENFEEQRDEISRRLNFLQQMKAYFDAAKEDATILVVPSFLGIEDPLLDALIQELITLNSEREPMIQNNQLSSPRLAMLNASIENLLISISENIVFRINVTSAELQEINNRIAKVNTEFARLPQTQRRLLGIERQFNLTQDVYTSLMEKRIQAQIARSSTLPDCVVVEPASFMGIKSPNRIISMAIAIFLGLLVPSTYVFGRRLLIEKIEDKEDIKRLCNLTQIGELPEYRRISGNVVINEPTEILAESFRTLRSNINFFLNGEKHKIILLTSSIPLEGKSMSSLNLATAFAIANNRTLLIRLDMRKASEEEDDFKQQELVGLSDYLINEAKLADIITQTEIHGLSIIPSGQIPPNPAELLSSEKINDLLIQAKQHFDYVIIDTPPFGLVSDAFMLMKYTDLNIYIARLGRITKRAFIPNMEEIVSKKLNNFYLLINGIKPHKSAYAKYADPYFKNTKSTKKRRKNQSGNSIIKDKSYAG
ncbi:MAG: polysaccharide biosynthesis tyrosine autokinase [Candidatus Kariarchaeaceae archaeon]